MPKWGYISHILNGQAHLSLEQGYKTAAFLLLNERERKYLLLMIEASRAGTKELQEHFEKELNAFRDECIGLNIKERLGEARSLPETEQSTYYSSWHYLAVHVVSSLKDYNDYKSIAAVLHLPETVVSQVLLFLLQTGIVKEDKGKPKPGLTQVHLTRESPFIRQHHTNLRVAAIQSLMSDAKTDVHYSTVSTLSKDDAEKLRSEMFQFIENYVETIKPSKEEVMYGFNLDFFNFIKK